MEHDDEGIEEKCPQDVEINVIVEWMCMVGQQALSTESEWFVCTHTAGPSSPTKSWVMIYLSGYRSRSTEIHSITIPSLVW